MEMCSVMIWQDEKSKSGIEHIYSPSSFSPLLFHIIKILADYYPERLYQYREKVVKKKM